MCVKGNQIISKNAIINRYRSSLETCKIVKASELYYSKRRAIKEAQLEQMKTREAQVLVSDGWDAHKVGFM
jgi:hypothetical protein